MVEIGIVALALYLLLRGGGKQPKPFDPNVVQPGVNKPPEPPPPPEPGDAPDPLEVWQPLVAPEPTVGRGYRIRKDEVFYGSDGIVARALTKALGRVPSTDERVAYYRAIGRVRSNWRLYGTLRGAKTGDVEAFNVRNADGEIVEGTITGALLPWHDSWPLSLADGRLPRRLIDWRRKGDGKLRAVPDAAEIAASGNRLFGVVWLPPLDAMQAGVETTYRADLDWPGELYAAAGTTWEEWVP